ncbi:MAG: ATP-binding protein [Anaerolineae bacterium]
MLNSLRVRLIVIFVSLTIIPIVVVGVLIGVRASNTLQELALDSQSSKAEQTANNLEAFFNERQNELITLTDTYGLTLLDSATQRDVLLALLSRQTAYYQLVLAQADGQETIDITRGSLVPVGTLPSLADDPLFQTVMSTRSVSFSPISFNDDARDRVVSIAVPITDILTGEIGNVLIAVVRFQSIGETILRDVNRTQDEDVYVLDGNGVVIAYRNPDLVINETTYQLPSQAGRVNGLNGTDVILGTHTIQLGNLDITVVAETPFTTAFSLASYLAGLSAVVTAITLIIAVLVVIVVVSRVVNPIVELSRVAQAIQQGDFSKRSDVKSRDEIGQFASAFNAMTDAIQKRENDLIAQAEELRIATAKSREAARVKGEFLANVSHELRTPLNAIIGFSDMLLAGMSGPLNDKQLHKMQRLRDNGSRLLTLINDLLDLTRIESGRLEVMEKPFSVRDLSGRMSAQMESIATQSGLKLETIIDPAIPQSILGDEKRVEQVYTNLVSNAIKFTKEGSVTINIEANVPEKVWTLAVTDTGIGIPPHAVNIIFEEFRQLDGTYSRAYKGSGLGLAITRNLVRMMGGKIAVKSELGKGSTFTVTLPLATPETRSVSAAQAVASS